MKINNLTQFQVEAIETMDKDFLSKFQKKGIENAKELSEIKTKLYLGDYKGKKVYFYATFTRNNIICKSNFDLVAIGKNFDDFTTYSTGRAKSFLGSYPTTRKGGSNITKITLAYLLAFTHICTFKKVGFVNNRPSKELVRELMYLTMPEVEGRSEDSKMYGVTWSSVLVAWDLEQSDDYHLYKRYFNTLVHTDLKNMNSTEMKLLEEKAS